MHLHQRVIAQNDRDKISYHMVGHIARFEPSTTQAGKKLVKKGRFFATFWIMKSQTWLWCGLACYNWVWEHQLKTCPIIRLSNKVTVIFLHGAVFGQGASE